MTAKLAIAAVALAFHCGVGGPRVVDAHVWAPRPSQEIVVIDAPITFRYLTGAQAGVGIEREWILVWRTPKWPHWDHYGVGMLTVRTQQTFPPEGVTP